MDYYKVNQIKAPNAGAVTDVTKFLIQTESEIAPCQAMLELGTEGKMRNIDSVFTKNFDNLFIMDLYLIFCIVS